MSRERPTRRDLLVEGMAALLLVGCVVNEDDSAPIVTPFFVCHDEMRVCDKGGRRSAQPCNFCAGLQSHPVPFYGSNHGLMHC